MNNLPLSLSLSLSLSDLADGTYKNDIVAQAKFIITLTYWATITALHSLSSIRRQMGSIINLLVDFCPE